MSTLRRLPDSGAPPRAEREGPEIDSEPLRYRAGDRVADKYLLIELLGQGGMGSVWRAENTVLGVDVAIKLMHGDQTDSDASERLEREAHAAARLEHPSIVRIFDLGHTDLGDPFIVMELLRGQSLRQYLEGRKAVAAEKAVALLLPVASALCKAHAGGIIHRDLKPENIVLVETEALGTVPKIVDFGIAKIEAVGPRRSTTSGTILGSPDYMSPEQARGEVDKVDARSDVWALGVVLYEMLAGQQPFRAENTLSLLRAIIEDEPEPLESKGVDAVLAALVQRAMSKDPAARPPDMKTFGRELSEWALANGVDTDLTGTNIAAHWGRSAHPSLTDSPAPPLVEPGDAAQRPRRLRSNDTLPGISNRSSGAAARSRVWVAVVAVLALAAGVALSLRLIRPPVVGPNGSAERAASPAANGVVTAAAVAPPNPSPSASASPSPGPSALAAHVGSVSASALASATPPDVSRCVQSLFPRGTFVADAKLGNVCTESDPRRGALHLRAEIARSGTLANTTTDAMREWALLSWYELAVFAGVHGACCPADASEIALPVSVGTCPDLGAALRAIDRAARSSTPFAAPLADMRLAVQCLAASKRMNPAVGIPYVYVDAGEGGAMTAAKRLLDRIRPPPSREP